VGKPTSGFAKGESKKIGGVVGKKEKSGNAEEILSKEERRKKSSRKTRGGGKYRKKNNGLTSSFTCKGGHNQKYGVDKYITIGQGGERKSTERTKRGKKVIS